MEQKEEKIMRTMRNLKWAWMQPKGKVRPDQLRLVFMVESFGKAFQWEEREFWVDKKALLCLCMCVHEYRIIITVIMMIKN